VLTRWFNFVISFKVNAVYYVAAVSVTPTMNLGDALSIMCQRLNRGAAVPFIVTWQYNDNREARLVFASKTAVALDITIDTGRSANLDEFFDFLNREGYGCV
jgi:hypothetical protein